MKLMLDAKGSARAHQPAAFNGRITNVSNIISLGVVDPLS